MRDGAALVVDNASGEILAYAGNIGEQSSARFVDGIRAMRQAGSTLKPLIYALAFDQRLLTPASLMDDSPLDIPCRRRRLPTEKLRQSLSRHGDGQSRPGFFAECPGGEGPESHRHQFLCRNHAAAGFPKHPRAGLLRIIDRARLGRHHSLGPCGRISRPGKRRRLESSATHRRGDAGSAAARRLPGSRLSYRRHTFRPRKPQPDLFARKPLVHPLLDGSKDGHEQRHARQLVRRLLGPIHGRHLGRQFFGRADV